MSAKERGTTLHLPESDRVRQLRLQMRMYSMLQEQAIPSLTIDMNLRKWAYCQYLLQILLKEGRVNSLDSSRRFTKYQKEIEPVYRTEYIPGEFKKAFAEIESFVGQGRYYEKELPSLEGESL